MSRHLVKIFLIIIAALLISGIGGFLRWHALNTLNVDYDEDDYLRAAQEYALLIRAGDWAGFLETNYRPEHPPFAKIVYGLSILGEDIFPLIEDRSTTDEPNLFVPRPLLLAGRRMSAVFGTLTVGILALLNPLAGIMLAIHAFTIKYVSQVMLEGLPALTSFLAVLTYVLWAKGLSRNQRKTGWLVLSSVFLGITAASKYLYCVVGLAIVADWLLGARVKRDRREPIRHILIWGVISLAAFLLFNPYLWSDPINRLKDSLLFHTAYSAGAAEVVRAGFPFWQPFIWLTTTPRMWQPNAMYVALDPLITGFAVVGILRLWQRKRVYALWLLIAIVFLLIWPTKWPQYIVILTVPLTLAAAEGFSLVLVDPIIAAIKRLKNPVKKQKLPEKSEVRNAAPWLLPGLVIFAFFTVLPLLFQVAVSLTDFSRLSIRDGLNGGILREVWGGLTGQVKPGSPQISFISTSVNYIGPRIYRPAMLFLTQQGILVFNMLWTIISVGLQTLLGVAVALHLHQQGTWLKKGWMTLFVLPWAIPEMIGALMWVNVFQPTTGWLSLGVQQYGEAFPLAFLLNWPQDMNLVLVVLLLSGVWYGFPFIMLASAAGLKMLPAELIDSAAIDGANGWQTVRMVTLPLLAPLLIPALIVRGIFAFNQFYLFQAFGFEQGTLATLSYNIFNDGQYSISAVVNVLGILLLTVFVILYIRRKPLIRESNNA